jgi:hypothetical protein
LSRKILSKEICYLGGIVDIRIRLDEDDYKKLVNGEEIEKLHLAGVPWIKRILRKPVHLPNCHSVKIILADIGFDRMRKHINDAYERSFS